MSERRMLNIIVLILTLIFIIMLGVIFYVDGVNNNYCKKLGYDGVIKYEEICYNSVNGMMEPSYERLPSMSERSKYLRKQETK